MFGKFLTYFLLLKIAHAAFTFRDVMVTCDSDNLSSEDEITFSTIVTTNRLKPHLPNDQHCYKISVLYASIPALTTDSLADITDTNFLLLENDRIEEIEASAFRNTRIKEALSLKSNNIREIRRDAFKNLKVPVLILSYNFISYIDYLAFANMTTLKSVHLNNNKLTRIDTFWFKNTPQIKKLDLKHNLIREVPANAFPTSLTNIDLSHNLINFVDRDACRTNKKLQTLNLSHNQLEHLDKFWLKDLTINLLDISYNRFTCLDYGLSGSYGTNYIDNNLWNCICLKKMKDKEFNVFGRLVGEESSRRCNLL